MSLNVKELLQWDTESVCKWCTAIELPMMVQYMQQHGIRGEDLLELERDDLRDMGVPVGPRLRMLQHLSEVKREALLLNKNTVIKQWEEYRCCEFTTCFVKNYTLTNSALTVKEPGCCTMKVNRIDLSTITDINMSETCCEGIVEVEAKDGGANIPVRTSEIKHIFDSLKDAWELDQALHHYRK